MPTNTIDKALGIKIEKLYQSNLSNIKFKLFTKTISIPTWRSCWVS